MLKLMRKFIGSIQMFIMLACILIAVYYDIASMKTIGAAAISFPFSFTNFFKIKREFEDVKFACYLAFNIVWTIIISITIYNIYQLLHAL